MKIIILILLILVIIYFVVRKSSFGASVKANPPTYYVMPTKGPVTNLPTISNYITSIDTVQQDTSGLVFKAASGNISTTCYSFNPDFSLNTTVKTERYYSNGDQYNIDAYLQWDCYANAFMNNLAPIPLSTALIDNLSSYTDATINLIGTTTYDSSTTTPTFYKNNTYKPGQTTSDITYYYLSWNSANIISKAPSTYITKIPAGDTLANISKKIQVSVLYSLITLYYNPSGPNYYGLVIDFVDNYPATLNKASVDPASTVGIIFTPFARHVIWLYLIARAQWVNNTLNTFS